MLSCLLNGQRINCYDGSHSKEQLKKWASKRILMCPACGNPYEYCHGKVKSPYFRHMDKEQCEDRFSEQETEEHLNGKRDLYEWLKKQQGVTNCVLEGWLPTTKQRPDIMFKYNGQLYVLEYQCSPIATEYIERHELYQAAGIKDVWVCGFDKYFNGGRQKFIENYCDGYYSPKSKIFYLNNNSLQHRTIISFKKLNREYEHKFHLKDFIFHNGEILFYCLKNQNYQQAFEKREKRKTLKKQLKTITDKEFENRIEFIKSNMASYKVTVHYPNYWDRTPTYIRFCRNSDNTLWIEDKEHIYLKINNFFRIEDINKKLKQYNKKQNTWKFYLCSDSNTLYVDIYDDKGNRLHEEEKYLTQDELIRIKKEETELKNILLETMIKCKDYVINSKNNYWKVIS